MEKGLAYALLKGQCGWGLESTGENRTRRNKATSVKVGVGSNKVQTAAQAGETIGNGRMAVIRPRQQHSC